MISFLLLQMCRFSLSQDHLHKKQFRRADNQVYFYNADDWGVEEAYKAFGPNYETCVTKDFIESCSNRVWVIDDPNGSAYEDLFGDKDYIKVSEKEFFTKYHDYSYKITLIEK